MTGNATPGHPTRPRAVMIAIVLVTVAALGTGLVIQATRSDAPGSSPAAAASAGTSPGSSSVADWVAVDVDEPPVAATLEANEEDVAGIAPDATLILASRSGEPARAIAQRLVVSPATEFAIKASVDGRTAALTPNAALTPGSTYRVALRTSDGALADSWAGRGRDPTRRCE